MCVSSLLGAQKIRRYCRLFVSLFLGGKKGDRAKSSLRLIYFKKCALFLKKATRVQFFGANLATSLLYRYIFVKCSRSCRMPTIVELARILEQLLKSLARFAVRVQRVLRSNVPHRDEAYIEKILKGNLLKKKTPHKSRFTLLFYPQAPNCAHLASGVKWSCPSVRAATKLRGGRHPPVGEGGSNSISKACTPYS